MSDLPIEEEYEDLLFNIESMVVSAYKKNPQLTDYDVLKAYEAVQKNYVAEKRSAALPPPPAGASNDVYLRVRNICEWYLGRQKLEDEGGKSQDDLAPEPVSIDVILACMKRVQKSANYWNKEGGRQGYLRFVSQFV